MTKPNSTLAALCFILCAAPLFGQTAAPTGFKDAYLSQLKDVESKIVSLAETTPQEKYSWRPAEGVRSVSEVFVHIATTNFFFVTMTGVKMPAGVVSPTSEKTVTEKAKVVALLKQSFEHVRNSVTAMSDADMAKETKMLGKPATYETVLFFMANHMHEHLGQSIAYARTNAIVPPWSKKEN
jgi:uncharacterized damage-inducible protein DinB